MGSGKLSTSPPAAQGATRADAPAGGARWRWLRVAALVVVLVTFDQAAQRLLLDDGTFRGKPVAPFDPPLFNAEQEASLERLEALAEHGTPLPGNVAFDAELGWAPVPDGGSGEVRYDWAGARLAQAPLARTRAAGTTRVVAVGCSFTHGDEVAALDTWPARLAALAAPSPRAGTPDTADAGAVGAAVADTGTARVRARGADDADPAAEAPRAVEVANLGVGAYGVDQALLRLHRDGLPLDPDEVWLGLMPGAALRVVTMYRPALRHHDPSVAFKPRFVLDNAGDLVLVHNPAESPGDAVRLVRRQDEFMRAVGQHDLWVARVPQAYMRRGTSWTHWFGPTRLLVSHVEGRLRDPAVWVENLDSEVSRLVRALVVAMARDVRAAGAVFRVVVLPDRKGLVDARDRAAAGAEPYWQPLVNGLRLEQIDVIDLTGELLAAGALDDGPGGAFWMPGGHYSPRANAVVAAALAPLVGASETAVAAADYFELAPSQRTFARVDKPKKRKTLAVAPWSGELTIARPSDSGAASGGEAGSGHDGRQARSADASGTDGAAGDGSRASARAGASASDRLSGVARAAERPRYSVTVPNDEGGLELVFSHEQGELLLEAFAFVSDEIDSGLVELATPALIGTASNHLGAAPRVTPVDQSCPVDVRLLGSESRIEVGLRGSVAASWLPAAPVTAGGARHDDVVALRLELDLLLTANLLGVPLERRARLPFSGLLARGVGYVEFTSGGDVYRLVGDGTGGADAEGDGAGH